MGKGSKFECVSLEPEVKDRLFDLPPLSVLLSERAFSPPPSLPHPSWLCFCMTKHKPEQSCLAQPVPSHLRNHRHQLDFYRNGLRSLPSRCVTRSSSARRTVQMAPLQPPRLEAPSVSVRTKGFMDDPPVSHQNEDGAHTTQQRMTQNASSRSGKAEKSGKKKNYQRYPKPPYSYLAMIAMVIQRSPEKKLTLSEIFKEISALFPLFKGSYNGWRDSIRHNLSFYDCFFKVLKDPDKPQGKGNFWAVDLSRVPPELLKRQNTAVSRQDETIFAKDLAPYILQDYKQISETPPDSVTSVPPMRSEDPSPSQDSFRPKLDSSFAIDSLLHSLRPSTASAEVDKDCLGEMERPRPSPPPQPRYTSSASSVSPASTASSSDEDWRGAPHLGKRNAKSYEDYRLPLHKSSRRETLAPPWELPTSYAKYAPPNAVAPPSMRFSGGPLMPLHGGIPFYSYSSSPVTSGHFLSHAYWPILPSRQVSVQAPPLLMDLDSMLQSVPPNKSVFDALMPTNQNSYSHQQPQSPYSLQNGAPLDRYHQY
ncbi:forkhead box protein H1 isoform X1 [Nothobranchius furzeri]|uniref:Forkhead box H1 n=1 Tax=Nothobranchius furzeri TaxID=105023 RepID=A0A8C6LHF0_NOTFU